MPLVELFFAVPALIWGGAIMVWLNTKGIVIKLWTVVWATVLSVVIPALLYGAASQGGKEIIRRVFAFVFD